MKAISRRSITLEARAPSNQDGQITFEELCRIWLANPERARKMAEDTSEWMFYRRGKYRSSTLLRTVPWLLPTSSRSRRCRLAAVARGTDESNHQTTASA
jgi:hypothetical protein